MSLHQTGWIECRNCPSPWFDSDVWAPVVHLAPIFTDDELPDTPSFASRLPSDVARLVAGQGLPDDVSDQVAQDAGTTTMPWYSAWIGWGALKADSERLTPGWRLILAMIEPLALECGEDNVRVIVWQYITG